LSVVCTQCGHRNDPDANFCSSCGASLRDSAGAPPDTTVTLAAVPTGENGETESVAVAIDELPSEGAMLLVRRGPNSGSKFLLLKDVTGIGRHPDSDIFLDDITVSRRHAEILREGSSFRVRDVGSLNGTYLNRERIEEATLTNGDEIQIGKFRLIFLINPVHDRD
jgi:pSer/pThr/pTyr-binding forkhead associated (FHA) protein